MKTIYAILALAVGAISANAAPVVVESLDKVSNNKVYTLQRDGDSNAVAGYIYVQNVTSGSQIYSAPAATADTTSVNAQFSLHYSPREKAYFLYNIGSGMFVSGNSKRKAVVTPDAVTCVPMFNEKAQSWLLLCGGYAIASDESNGFVMFLDDQTRANTRKVGSHFRLNEKQGVTLSDAEVEAIEQKIAEGREAILKTYRTFLSNAQSVISSGDLARYIGDYDVEELAYALDHADDYTLAEFAEMYETAVLSRFPKEGKYYRLHNATRPGSRVSNILSTTIGGVMYTRTLSSPGYGKATGGCSDDLGIFRVYYKGSPRRVIIKNATFDQYFKGGENFEHITMTSDPDGATVYDIEFPAERQKKLYMRNVGASTWLTVTSVPECRLWGYNVKEDPSEWYFEEVNTLNVPVDANGYATFCAPCGVEVPEGVKVYTVTDFGNGKAYVEEIAQLVHRGTPCILKATPGTSSVELAIRSNQNWVGSAMTGNVRATASTPGRYVPEFSDKGISFKYAESSNDKALPGSCYIVSDNKGAVETVMGANPDSAIEEISADEAVATDLYDLMGRPVKSGTVRPGVYIDATSHKTVRVK